MDNKQQVAWQQMYSDVYPDNTCMRIDSAPKLGLTRLTVIGANGIEVCYVFAQTQAFQAAYALLKSLNTIGHVQDDMASKVMNKL